MPLTWLLVVSWWQSLALFCMCVTHLCLYLHLAFSLCACGCPQTPLLEKQQSFWIGTTQKTLSPNNVKFWDTGVSTSTHEFCCSVAQSCPTLCHPMDFSTPGFSVHHYLLEFTQTHVHQVGDAIWLSHPLSTPSPPAFSLSQHQSLFQWVNSLQAC